jgi:hypothetical protein
MNHYIVTAFALTLMAPACGHSTAMQVKAPGASGAPASSAATAYPRDGEGLGRALVEALKAGDSEAFMRLVTSEASMTEIVKGSTAPEDAKVRMLAELPSRVAPRREAHAAGYAQIVADGTRRGLPWSDIAFDAAEISGERVDGGTMTRHVKVRFTAGDTGYSLMARECISLVGGPVHFLGEIEDLVSKLDEQLSAARSTVRAAFSAASSHAMATNEFPSDINALAKYLTSGEAALIDPWKTPLTMSTIDDGVKLCSAGPDRTHDTDDDLCWPNQTLEPR